MPAAQMVTRLPGFSAALSTVVSQHRQRAIGMLSFLELPGAMDLRRVDPAVVVAGRIRQLHSLSLAPPCARESGRYRIIATRPSFGP